jgi:ABC-type metal ion transport system substrate-binding protein
MSRFSRGLAFLQTDTLQILKQKKKKQALTEADIAEVTSNIKVILIEKLEIPQSNLHDSL